MGKIQTSIKNKSDEAEYTALKSDVKKLYSNLQRA